MSVWKHIYPLNDLREHILKGRSYWCNPVFDEEDLLVIHNALDGREQIETGERKVH